MDLQKAKRFASFLYWIPATIIILMRVPIPPYLFIALPLPYFLVIGYLINKTPKTERSNVEYTRVVLIAISHLILFYLMFFR